ncbi:MAG: RNA polymerase-binding protein RbpA [Jiangellales bacterium]
MAERSTLRGSRLGAVSYEDERGVVLAERQNVEYDCPNGHDISVVFATEADIPALWECPKCGAESLLVDGQEPDRKSTKAARTHWDMLLERRSIDELEALLSERLNLLRAGSLSGFDLTTHVSPTVPTRRGRKTA